MPPNEMVTEDTCYDCGMGKDLLQGIYLADGYDANGGDALHRICSHCYLFRAYENSPDEGAIN